MKSLYQIFITLSLIIFSICADDCAGKTQDQCTGTCSWTAGKAASCAVVTCTLNQAGTGCNPSADDCTFAAGENNAPGTCTPKAQTCAVSGTACNPVAGCKYTAATDGSCATKPATTSQEGEEDGTFKLKISLILALLVFLL